VTVSGPLLYEPFISKDQQVTRTRTRQQNTRQQNKNHSHEHKASNGATTLNSRSRRRRPQAIHVKEVLPDQHRNKETRPGHRYTTILVTSN